MLLTGIAVATAACGGADSTAPRSLAATPLPASIPSDRPAAVSTPSRTSGKQAERAAVMAVVRRYFRASNHLDQDMSPAPLQSLLARACPCQAQIESVRAARRTGEHFSGRATIHALRANLAGPTAATVLADYAFSRGGLVDPTGAHVTTIKPRSHIHWLFGLRRIAGRWVITRIGDA
jgi:hypothetical protein